MFQASLDDDIPSLPQAYSTPHVHPDRHPNKRKLPVEEDEYETFCRSLAPIFHSILPDQRIHARKLLSDVMYEAQLGTLSRMSSVVTELRPVHQADNFLISARTDSLKF